MLKPWLQLIMGCQLGSESASDFRLFGGRFKWPRKNHLMCVCVTSEQYRIDVKPLLFSFFFLLAGGSSTIASLLPTKTLAIGGDTRPDQSGVSALFVLPTWHGAKPRTQQQKFWFYTVVAIWDFLWRRFQPYLHSIFHGHGKGLSQEPYSNYFLFQGLCLWLVCRFRNTFNLFAVFIEEIYLRSLFLILVHVRGFCSQRIT